MLNSIRWSLQLWHAGLLAVVLTGFGSASYYAISRAHYQEVDSQLERSVLLLANELRYPPRPPGIGRGGGGRGGRGGGRGGGPDRPPDRNPGGPGGFGPGGEGPGGPGGGAGFGPGRFGPGGPPGGGPGAGPGGPRVDPNLTEIEVPPNIAQRFGDGESDTFYYVLWDFDREMTKTSRTTADIPEPPPRSQDSFGPPPPPNAEPPTLRERGNFREYYVYGPAGPILVGKSTLPDRAQLHQSALLLAAAGAAVLVIGLVGGWLLSFRAVRPIRTITKAAQEISATNLSRRINVAETQNELGTLASVLNDAFARLDAAFQQQVRFTADASHELRTPLAVIHTNTQLALSRERSAEEYRKTIETCQRASSRMKGLVDSLLVLAKADAGRLSLEPSRFDLSSVVQDCMAMVTPLAQEKHVSLESDLRAVELTADLSRVGQVVTNLLSNAIRYNREGGSVRAKVESVGKDAVLTITDTGVGIPAENQPHLFERFYRVDAARSRELGGSGLGLAICKSIVEAHGGTIFFQSEFGKGSTFTIRLPLGPAAAPPN